MYSRRDVVEGLQFVIGMPLIAALIFGGMWLVIQFGSVAVRTWYGLFSFLPHAAAATLAVMAAALTVYITISLIGRHWPHKKP